MEKRKILLIDIDLLFEIKSIIFSVYRSVLFNKFYIYLKKLYFN